MTDVVEWQNPSQSGGRQVCIDNYCCHLETRAQQTLRPQSVRGCEEAQIYYRKEGTKTENAF